MLKLEARAEPSGLWTYASPLLALLVTVLVGALMFTLLGKDPLRGLQMFFWLPINSGYAWGELLVKATPLLIIALGLLTVLNMLATVKYAVGDLARVESVLKVLGMVNAAPEFEHHPKVIDGFSDVLLQAFGDAGRHARSAVSAASLPFGVAVEIEAIFELN